MKLALTPDNVRTLTLKGRNEEFIWDVEVPGFGLRLWLNKGKLGRVYLVQYRFDGKTRRLKIGDPRKLTLNQAREQGRKLLAQVLLGRDPAGEKAARHEAAKLTFAKVVQEFLAGREGKRRRSTMYQDKLYLTGDYFGPFHGRGIASITRADVIERMNVIERNHTPFSARTARKVVSKFFVWALGKGMVEINPVVGTPSLEEAISSRERVLSNDELVAIWRACEPQARTDQHQRPSWQANDDAFGYVIRLLILTAARRGEIGGMCWSELDLAAGTWTLPAARSKNHRAHTLPLPQAALDILAAIPRGEHDSVFGFKGSARGFGSWDKHKGRLERRLGDAVQSWWLHDLRRTAATGMADIGVVPHVIEQILNHISGHKRGVAGIYNRSRYDEQVKVALQRWSEHVLALVEGRPGANVVALHSS
jgi:integrase